MTGIFAEVYLVDGVAIRKVPRGRSGDEMQPIIREATIYSIMDSHPHLARYISRGRMDLVEVEYYPHGDLFAFCQGHKVSAELQSRKFQQIIEAVAVVQYKVIHSDLALRQFFIDDEFNLHLGDFNSSRYPGHPAPGYEKATHCLPRGYEQPNSIISDLFAMGSTLFELVTGHVPFAELYPVEPKEIAQSSDHAIIRARVQRQHDADTEVGRRFRNLEFPVVSQIDGGDASFRNLDTFPYSSIVIMAREGNVTTASTALGTIGTVFWCIQLVPQIWHNWRRKKTEGFPALMGFLWAACAVPMGVYLILQQVNLPLQIQPQIFGVLSAIIWAQVLHYGHGYTSIRAILACLALLLVLGGLEALLLLTLRIPYNRGIHWPDILVGVIATIMLGAGFLPVYPELWKRDGRVVGFNWVFLCMDTLGGLFSLFALAAQGSFDVLGGIMYIVVVLLEMGIYTSHIVWRIRYRKVRREAKLSGRSLDELLEPPRPEMTSPV
ncbi:PQ loop repeat protein [Penicillium capsulatum]|uniref:PQ loop repeat protein n=1 Tax=Penicillium capsulatum TaxID=69766 RepID=A0A9W9LW80_9EURO|nr:PQ loop repeat protein [Penicillium capsulatum]KAJ6122384.1 PQ loop repeat protein [Penicillium capsulatum]